MAVILYGMPCAWQGRLVRNKGCVCLSLVYPGPVPALSFSLPQVLGLKLPNLLGRAEKVTFQFSYGTKETSYGLSFFKPQPGNFERK